MFRAVPRRAVHRVIAFNRRRFFASDIGGALPTHAADSLIGELNSASLVHQCTALDDELASVSVCMWFTLKNTDTNWLAAFVLRRRALVGLLDGIGLIRLCSCWRRRAAKWTVMQQHVLASILALIRPHRRW